MERKRKHSSALKVGILTLSAISILIFTVLWVKGRSLSAGERINIAFKDINGMRAGSAVQMMGLRIGQVEEITPVIKEEGSYVNLRFVVTEKGVKIPNASTISIQQSGIIGEQFLEVTPPRPKYIYNETSKSETALIKGQPIYMKLSEGLVDIGSVYNVEVVSKSEVPYVKRDDIKTNYAIKLAYIIELPGLSLDNDSLKFKIDNGKLIFFDETGIIPKTPSKDLKYTVIEPMRLSDFMDLQFRAAKSLAATNDKISDILSDEFIGDLKGSVDNIRILTSNANTTLDKARIMIDANMKDIESLISQSEVLVKSLTKLSDNINDIVSDETLKNDVISSIKSVGQMSDNINKILEDSKAEEILSNVADITNNVNDISRYVDEFASDKKVRDDMATTLANVANITEQVSNLINDYNKLEDNEKLKLKSTVKDVLTITRNLKKFSEKLNKRFLLFRLMF